MAKLNDKKNLLRDSYQLFFEHFNITKEDFYNFGLEATIFSDEDKARAQWEQLKEKLFSNQMLHIRQFGRNGNGTEMFFKLYEYLFDNTEIRVSPTDNHIPQKNIAVFTGYKRNKDIINFQVSHIFGHTKNPLLFEAVWNICFTPKIIDPFTGNESKGYEDYQKQFQNYAYSKYKNIIDDYNKLVTEKDILNKINLYINSIKGEYEKTVLTRFSKAAQEEWSLISV